MPDYVEMAKRAMARLRAERESWPDHDLMVQARATIFRDQVFAWIQSGVPGVPLLTLPNVDPAEGSCVSCGVLLDGTTTWRCSACLAAVLIALADER